MNIVVMFAWYEIKLTLRSHTFHIFAFIAVAVQTAAAVLLYIVPSFSNWSLRAIPSSLPYTATLLFNALAAIGLILLATEFLNNDLKLDTAQSVYYRNFPTPLYFFGKGVGIVVAMLGLEMVILLIPFIVNLFFLTDTPVSIAGYLFYPLILTVPALLFITGLSWLMMLLTKSQSFAFIGCVIILIAAGWSENITGLHHLLDYPGIRIPALYGDFLKFGGAGSLLIQRSVFAALGIGLMAVSSFLLSRLSQSKKAGYITAGLAVIMVIAAVQLSAVYFLEFNKGKALRTDMRALNHEYGSQPRITVTDCDLAVEHKDNIISAAALLKIENRSDSIIGTYLFSLNPSLIVEKVAGNSGNLSFTRNRHLLFVTPSSTLASGESDSLVFFYKGSISEESCYLDIPESERADCYPISLMNVRRSYGTITPNCVFLTPETLWYPIAGVPYGSTFPELPRKDFPNFTLSVASNSGLEVVSQGNPEKFPDGSTVFQPSTPLPHVSLAIADYQMKTVEVDSVAYSLYYLSGHDYFSPYLSGIENELPELIKNRLSQMERQYSRPYPFDYFTAVEVPIQFYPAKRSWTVIQDNIQPGMVFINEKGTFMRDIKSLERALKSMRNSNLPENQISSTFFMNIISPMMSESYDTGNNLSSVYSRIPFFSLNSLYRIVNVQDDFVYNVFPNFYSFTNHLYSPKWPIIDAMMERYLAIPDRSGVISIGGDSFNAKDTANMLLMERNLPKILSGNANSTIASVVMSAKMNQLFASFRANTSGEEFTDWLNNAIIENRFITSDFNTFMNSLGDGIFDNIDLFLEEWYHATDLPICRLSDFSHTEVPGEDRNYYQLKITISNPGKAEGLFQISGATLDNSGPDGRSNYESFERYVSVPAGEARCIYIFDDIPFYRQITVNTFVSQNLPSSFSIPVPEASKGRETKPFDGVLKIDPPELYSEPGCVIVDDSDPGCVANSNYNPPIFQKLLYGNLENDEEFIPIQFIYPLDKWLNTFDASFYGDYVRSGMFKKPGDGSQPVIWSAELPEPGTYDVYAHLSISIGRNVMISMRGESKPRPMIGTFHYTVHHDAGSSTVDVETSNQNEEWVYLGSFNFSDGNAVVELSDKTDGRIIYADAIKWIRK